LEAQEDGVGKGDVPGESAGSARDRPPAEGRFGRPAVGGGCRDSRTESGERKRGSTDAAAGRKVSHARGLREFGELELDRGGVDSPDLLQ
jgi:hypothetical protein